MGKTLEDQIKELERELALKSAYLSAVVSFPKNTKLPQDVQEEVVNTLKTFAVQKAEQKDLSNQEVSLLFSEEEVAIIKQLISAVKNRPAAQASGLESHRQVATQVTTNTRLSSNEESGKTARLLTTDGIAPTLRGRVAPEARVVVRKVSGGRAIVMSEDGIVFQVPEEDLDFNI